MEQEKETNKYLSHLEDELRKAQKEGKHHRQQLPFLEMLEMYQSDFKHFKVIAQTDNFVLLSNDEKVIAVYSVRGISGQRRVVASQLSFIKQNYPNEEDIRQDEEMKNHVGKILRIDDKDNFYWASPNRNKHKNRRRR